MLCLLVPLLLTVLGHVELGSSCTKHSNSAPCIYNDSFQNIQSHCSIVNVTISVSVVALNENLIVRNTKEFTLQGLDENTTVVCSGDSGLTFIHVCNVTIMKISFNGCGTSRSHSIGSFGALNFHYALFASGCQFVSLQHTRIINSRGAGLVLVNNRNISVTHSKFTKNVLNTSESRYINETSYSGGGGIYLEWSCSGVPCTSLQDCFCSHSSFNIEKCTFSWNHAAYQHSSSNISDSGNSGLGNGGALEVWINDSSYNIVHMNHSDFLNNSAVWGGAIQIIISTGSQNNVIFLEHSLIYSNTVSDNGGGGLDLINNSVLINHINFTQNRAVFGGGMAIFTHKASGRKHNVISLSNCKWFDNSAHYGAAINVAPQRTLVSNEELVLSLTNCSFESNGAFPRSLHKHVQRNGKGVLMITGGIVTFIGRVNFTNNNSTCIHAISSTLLFSQDTDALFLNNSARKGAGISLIGYSVILVGERTSLTFCNNSVARYGAAIYYFSIDKNAYVHPRSCFIQKLYPAQSSVDVYFNFGGNTRKIHPVYGNSKKTLDAIYGTSLKACSSSPQSRDYEFYHVGNFRQCKSCPFLKVNSFSEKNTCIKRPSTFDLVSNMEADAVADLVKINFIPGKKNSIPLPTTVTTLYDVTIENHQSSNITVPKSFSTFTGRIVLRGRPGDRATITFTEIFFRKLSVSLEAEALDCPPLYKVKDSTCVCFSTEDVNFVEFHKCTKQSMYQASIRRGYWISYVENDKTVRQENNVMDRYDLLNSYCPPGYCYKEIEEDYIMLPQQFSHVDLNDAICNSRHETLCGLCQNDTTVYFHSEYFRCDRTDLCHLGPLFYLLSEILPLTFLFLVIIFFNISFTSGYLNGFIFYAQIYDTIANIGSSFISPSYQFNKLSIFHRLFYKLFNIDFFNTETLSFCLFKTQNTLDILLVKYLTVGYAFFLVLGTVWLIRCCSKFRILRLRKSRYSVIQGLSAFLVMVYSQCAHVSLSILNLIYIYKGTTRYKTVVFLQGNIDYFSLQHLPYAIPALLCLLLFVAPVPLLLIVYPLCNKVIARLKLENNRFIKLASKLMPVTKIKPLLDCFQGTFKDDFRFFAGLHFVYRVTILSSRFASGVILIFTIVEIQLILMLAIHTFVWPYQKKVHNVIDLFVFANLAIINGLKLLSFFYAENGIHSKVNISKIHVVQLLCIYIPIIALLLAIPYKFLRKVKELWAKKRTGCASTLSENTEERSVSQDDFDNFLDTNRRSLFASGSYRLMRQKKLESSF